MVVPSEVLFKGIAGIHENRSLHIRVGVNGVAATAEGVIDVYEGPLSIAVYIHYWEHIIAVHCLGKLSEDLSNLGCEENVSHLMVVEGEG